MIDPTMLHVTAFHDPNSGHLLSISINIQVMRYFYILGKDKAPLYIFRRRCDKGHGTSNRTAAFMFNL